MVIVNPATVLATAQLAKMSADVGTQKLREAFNYDFVGLTVKIIIFYIFSYTISKIFEAIIYGGTLLNSFTTLFGVKLPSALPESLVTFFTTGYNGFKFWDIIKIISVLFVIAEFSIWFKNEENAGRTPSPSSIAVFAVLVLGLSLITFPEIIQKLKENKILTGGMFGK